jgi:YQGE family putative transporter
MPPQRLQKQAWLVLLLNGLYSAADALCSVFVGVYLWINSLSIETVCLHFLAQYIVTAIFYLLAGWYAQARDRVHVFRFGLVMHAVFYGTLLYLGEGAAEHAVPLGALMGVAWGFFWAGNNVFNYDVVRAAERDYFFGWLTAVTGVARWVAPFLSGLAIQFAPDARAGYHLIFGLAALLYLVALVASLRIPPDPSRRPYRLGRALFPPREHRDWRLMLAASATLAGSFSIFSFLLGLLMFLQTSNALSVGVFASFQDLTGMLVAYLIGRSIVPRTRARALAWAVGLLVTAGFLVLWDLNTHTLIAFGFLRSISGPLFSIPHSSIRFDVLDRCMDDPADRIAYLSAWEVPLAAGRVLMMGAILLLSSQLSELGIRIALFLLCANRILTYLLLVRTSVVRDARG